MGLMLEPLHTLLKIRETRLGRKLCAFPFRVSVMVQNRACGPLLRWFATIVHILDWRLLCCPYSCTVSPNDIPTCSPLPNFCHTISWVGPLQQWSSIGGQIALTPAANVKVFGEKMDAIRPGNMTAVVFCELFFSIALQSKVPEPSPYQ